MALNKVIALSDTSGNLVEVHIDDVLNNSGSLTTFSQKVHSLDGTSKLITVDDSSNAFALNGSILTKDVDYTVVNAITIELYDYTLNNSNLIELKGSFKTQAQLSLNWIDGTNANSTIVVDDSIHLFLYDNGTSHRWLEKDIDYSIIDETSINLLFSLDTTFKIGEFSGGGANGLDGYSPVKGLDYFDGQGFYWQGEYIEGNSYVLNDVVRYFANTYICINPTSSTINPKDNLSDWDLLIKGSNVQFDYGSVFPILSPENIGSYFQKDNGRLYIYSTMDGTNFFWRQIG